MFKTKIVLDEDKIKTEGMYYVEQCKNKLAEICQMERLTEETPNLYILDNKKDALGTRLTLLGELQVSKLLYYLKEWKNYSDEESDNGSLEESDMLRLCRDEGLLDGNY